MRDKKVLVTGGAGFLGTNLCRRLIDEGSSVIALDNLSCGKFSNVEKLLNYNNFEFIRHDIIFPIDLKVDFIFNLACPASPPRYQSDPIQTIKTNVMGALNMLELAKKNKARILQASTSEVYGDPIEHPQRESYRGNVNPIGIRACYDEGKRCAESLFFDYFRAYDLDIKIVRIFNTYGPFMDFEDGRVVSNFIIRALKNEPLEVYGDGSQTRSFCFVDDMVEGLIKMMGDDKKVEGPVNLGDPNELTVLEIARLITRLTKSSSRIVFKDLPEDDPVKRRPDIDLAKQILDWKPKMALEDGLRKTISYFRSVLKSKKS